MRHSSSCGAAGMLAVSEQELRDQKEAHTCFIKRSNMPSQLVDLQVKDSFFVLKLADEKKLNALSPDMLDQLETAWQQIEADQTRHIVVLTGLGKAFCVGADIKHLAQTDKKTALKYVRRIGELFDSMRASRKVIIAGINGYALGGGAELMLSCDLVVAAKEAAIGFPEVQLGLLAAAGGTTLLPAYVGLARAKELLLLGEKLTAQQALETGLINRVVETNLPIQLEELAQKMAGYPATALGRIKSIVNRHAVNYLSIRQFEQVCFAECFSDGQAVELRSKFAEK